MAGKEHSIRRTSHRNSYVLHTVSANGTIKFQKTRSHEAMNAEPLQHNLIDDLLSLC